MKHGATLAVVAVLLLACVALAGDHPLLVTPAWLAERLGRADVRIVDLSDAEDYAKGHIPGALHLDLADAWMQASEGVLRLFARLGITPDTTVVLYDDGTRSWDARYFRVVRVSGD